MQLRLVKRLLRLEANRNSYLPDYQQHFPLAVVVDSHNRSHEPHPPQRPQPSLPLTGWWRAFGGETPPQADKFGIMFTGHRKPGLFGALGQPHTNSYQELLRRGRREQGQRLGSSRLRRLSHLRRPLPPELALTATHPLRRRRWRSVEQRRLAPRELLKRSEARRLKERRSFGQEQEYHRWVREIFGKEGKELLRVAGGRRRLMRHFAAQPRPNYQLHYAAHHPTPLWVYAAGLRPHLAPLAADQRWWRRLQRREGRSQPRSFWSGYARAGQRLLRRERWLQLRLERYPLELLRRRFGRSLEMADRHLLVADPQRWGDEEAPRFWNKWTPLRQYLGRQWRYLGRYFGRRKSLKAEPMLLALQLGVDFHLLQRNLAVFQRQELLDPQSESLQQLRVEVVAEVLLRYPLQYPAAVRQLRRELRRRVADRGSFGALLEPLLRGSGTAASSGELNLLRTEGSLPGGRCQADGGPAERRRRRLLRRLGRRLARSPQPSKSGTRRRPGLGLPRPLGRRRQRLGFQDYLLETLGVSGPTAAQQRRLGRATDAPEALLQRRPEQRRLPQAPEGLGHPANPRSSGREPEQRRRSVGRAVAGRRGLQLLEQTFGRGYRRPERLRDGPRSRGGGSRQVQLRGRREHLLAGYLHVETDLHPFRGWPVDYHRDQCWDFWRLDRSMLPVTTLKRLGLELAELPRELQRYLQGHDDYYTEDQKKALLNLRGREREDFEKKVVAELKKLCPPATNQDRLETDPIWQPGLEWWKPRYVPQASLHSGRPRRRCTQGTNRAARAPARLYQRVFLPRLMGALEGEYKMMRQLMPFTVHHPYSYRWRRLGRRYRHYGTSLERFVRWGPRYGRRVNRVLEMGRPLGRRLQRRLFVRSRPGETNPSRLPSGEWRLRLRQLRNRRKFQRRRGYSLTWMNHPVTRVRTDARANLVTGVISHLRWSYDYVLRRRRVRAYRWSRKGSLRLELKLRRWRQRGSCGVGPGRERRLLALRPLPTTADKVRWGGEKETPERRRERLQRRERLLGHRRRWRLLPRRRWRRRLVPQTPSASGWDPRPWHRRDFMTRSANPRDRLFLPSKAFDDKPLR